MGRALSIGLVISVAWSLLLAGLFAYEPNPAEVVGRALAAALVAIILFVLIAQRSNSGLLGIALIAVAVVLLGYLVLVPMMVVVSESFAYGDVEFLFEQVFQILFDPYYWELRFADPYTFLPPSDLLIVALVVTIAALRGGESPEAAMTQGSASAGYKASAGIARRHDWSEINRLILAHAWTGGSAFRRSVIDRARESFDAPAPEVGIDMERLVKLCRWREGKETGYRVLMLAFLIAGFVGFTVLAEDEDPALLILVLLAVAVVNGYRRADIYAKTHELYGLGNFSEDRTSEAEGVSLSDEDTHGLPPEDQNVVVYSGFTPFEFAGMAMGGWTVSIDTALPSASVSAPQSVKPFTEGELRDFMKDRLHEAKFEGLSIRDLVFAEGTDAPALPAARTYREISQPRVQLDAEELDRLPEGEPNTFRRYIWIAVRDWGGELLVSAFWRCALKENMLHVEVSHFLLLPVASKHRKVDTVKATWQHWLGQFVGGAILSPLALVGGPLVLLGQMQLGLARLFGSEKRQKAKTIKLKARYNFGAPRSLRAELMGSVYLHYFQKMDQDHYQRSLNKILLENLVSFLDDHGIDTADLKETQNAIFNSGVIVQGGDITAQSLAVGPKSQARTGIVGRALERSGAASGSTKKR